MKIRKGDKAEHSFTVTKEDMENFIALSGDDSRVHTDSGFAKSKGYEDVIVYGGILLAKLSYMVGCRIPGPSGVSMSWHIDYRTPLYVGQEAVISIETVSVSKLIGVVESKFGIKTEGRLVADGKAQSIVSPEMIEE